MTSSPLPDAAPTNWVDRHAPAALRPWLKLGRFDRPAGIWLLTLPGWQGIALAGAERGRWPSLWLLAAMLAGATLMRAAGCAFNDIVDRDIDAKVARTASRPVASGQISVRQAVVFLSTCSLLSLAILVTMGPLAIGLGVASLALVAIYPFMKRITWWPQAWLGLTFNWGALLGYAAATGRLDPAAGLLYASGLFWTLGYDTIYAVQDLEDDALAGVKSSARRLGAAAPKGILAFYLIAVVLAVGAAAAGGLGLLFLPPAALFAAHLIGQARRLRIDDPMGALTLFKSNRDAGLILFIALAAGHWGAPALLFGAAAR
jgi:4-hydroxybenzoate polyprenyltransferase